MGDYQHPLFTALTLTRGCVILINVEGSFTMTKRYDNFEEIRCPVCNEVIVDGEDFYGFCPHVVVSYSDMAGEFIYVNDALYEIAEEMDKKLESEEYSNMEDILIEFVDTHDEYVLLTYYSEGIACGPVSNTDYVIFKVK